LLALWSVISSACPIPDYEIYPELNGSVEIDPTLLQPPLDTSIKVALNCDTVPVEFRLDPAIFDPDEDDTLNVFWLVNNEDDIGNVDAIGFDFDFDACSPPAAAANDDYVRIEAFIMDRPPAAFDAAGVHETTGDGTLIRLSWDIEITERGECFCQ
jgi:hypothetical protein